MRKSFSILALFSLCLLGAQWAKADTCNGVASNLVQNCAFGTGDFTGWSGTAPSDPFNGVDQGDPLAIGSTPYNGLANEAFLGSSSLETLEQSFTTVAGRQYTIEFALLNDTDPSLGYGNEFIAAFDGLTMLSESNVAADGYTLYSYTLDATSDLSTLVFSEENPSGDFELDSVSVEATPEPGSFLLLATGLLLLAGLTRRRLCR